MKTSDIDSDGKQIFSRFTKLLLDPTIDTDKENEGKKLAKLLKRYTENKEELKRNAKDLHKVISILNREKKQTICFEEYCKQDEQQDICKIIDKDNRINLPLPEKINTMKKFSKYSVDELKELKIFIKSHCENEHEYIEDFLLSFSSTHIEEIRFHGHSICIKNENHSSKDEFFDYYEVFPCSSYFFGLRDAMSKTTKFVMISRILFSSKEFSAILRAAKHVEKLYFLNIKILTDGECELGQMEGCQIKNLRVGYFIHVYKHPRDYEDSCMKIFLSIVGCTNLLRSLREIELKCGWKMEKKLLSKAKKILGNDYDVLMPNFKCL